MQYIILLPILLFSIIIHECAHGWVAERCGDPTARLSGRLTLNPIPHIDLMGTIVLPLLCLLFTRGSFIIGWAKPVPVNFANLRNPKQDMIWVALAGPASNIILALLCAVALKTGIVTLHSSAGLLLGYTVFINLLLAVFNLIPIPPLDGSRILMGFLPPQQAYSYSRIEPFGFIIIIGLLFMGFLKLIFNIVAALSSMLGVHLPGL